MNQPTSQAPRCIRFARLRPGPGGPGGSGTHQPHPESDRRPAVHRPVEPEPRAATRGSRPVPLILLPKRPCGPSRSPESAGASFSPRTARRPGQHPPRLDPEVSPHGASSVLPPGSSREPQPVHRPWCSSGVETARPRQKTGRMSRSTPSRSAHTRTADAPTRRTHRASTSNGSHRRRR